MSIRRAERLERKDLTAQLTETKTYMGGFTQPRHLHFLNPLDPNRKAKDSYDVRAGENRVRPAAEAYEPHSVYIAVTRYPVRWGHGRATRRECLSGFCKTSELADTFRKLNYGEWRDDETRLIKLAHGRPREPVVTPAHWHCARETKEYIDLAVLPGSPEERSLVNKPVSQRLGVLLKEIKREQTELATLTSDPDAYRASVEMEEQREESFEATKARKEANLERLERLARSTRLELAPPVSKDTYVRRAPPYLDERLVVPLVCVTFPTRPLAATVARLSNGHPRGLPFIASVPDQDRRDGPSLFRRLLRMRANRLFDVSRQLVSKLSGDQGGLMGLRLTPDDKGRGVDGEGLERDVDVPEGGWADVAWLTAESDVWDGIDRDSCVALGADLESEQVRGAVRTGIHHLFEDAVWSRTVGETTTSANGSQASNEEAPLE